MFVCFDSATLCCFVIKHLFVEVTNLLQLFGILAHGTITRVYKSSFNQTVTVNSVFVCFRIITTKCFATETNNFYATELFFGNTKFSFIVFFCLVWLVRGTTLVVGLGKSHRYSIHFTMTLLFHWRSDTIIQITNRAGLKLQTTSLFQSPVLETRQHCNTCRKTLINSFIFNHAVAEGSPKARRDHVF